MKHMLLLLAFLIPGAVFIQAQTPRPEVKILMEIRPEVNYVTHLYTLAGLGFADSAYAAKYGNTLPQAAIDPIVEEFKEYTQKLDSKRDLTYVPWSAFESLACWYNCKIAGRKTADYRAFGEADVQTFCWIFDRLSKDGISNPAELYRKGIMEYLEYGNNERKTEADF